MNFKEFILKNLKILKRDFNRFLKNIKIKNLRLKKK